MTDELVVSSVEVAALTYLFTRLKLGGDQSWWVTPACVAGSYYLLRKSGFRASFQMSVDGWNLKPAYNLQTQQVPDAKQEPVTGPRPSLGAGEFSPIGTSVGAFRPI